MRFSIEIFARKGLTPWDWLHQVAEKSISNHFYLGEALIWSTIIYVSWNVSFVWEATGDRNSEYVKADGEDKQQL